MIGVIADDLTGAAELGGVAWRRGLRAEVLLKGRPDGATDVACLDIDSRNCPPEVAAERATAGARLLLESGAKWIYKKVDSVLRGAVTAEVEAAMQQAGLSRAVLLPANPSRGRVIRDGRYFVGGVPIDETEFARDPAHPRLSAKVLDLLGEPGTVSVRVCRVEDRLPGAGIVVGEAGSAEEVRRWAARWTRDMLPAGGAEFFDALLTADGVGATRAPGHAAADAPSGRELFVCGTTSGAAGEFAGRARARGTPVFSLPGELAQGAPWTSAAAEGIAGAAAAAFTSHRRVILNVGLPLVSEPAVARSLAGHLVEVAQRVLGRVAVEEVYAEGGATAAELAHRLNWGRLLVWREVAPGVATLAVEPERALKFTLKPGSYAWPAEWTR